MPQGSPVYAARADLPDDGSVTFDASDATESAAVITSVYGDVDCQVYIEEHDGEESTDKWVLLGYVDASGDEQTELIAHFHTQFNRVLIWQGELRLKFVDTGGGGRVGIDGYEAVTS